MRILVFLLCILGTNCFCQSSVESFEIRQDSLRSELLKFKNDTLLLGTVIEEHYIRGLVKNEGDQLKFVFPFDLHAPDCGAPDCYTTELIFQISNKYPLKFPDEVEVKIYEYGCVKNQEWSSSFSLAKFDKKQVNYYSADLRSNLYFTKDGRLIYFPHNERRSLGFKELEEKLFKNESDGLEIPPYESTVMKSYEYANFFGKR